MNKRQILIFILLFVFLPNCSFDDKTGIWGEGEKEKKGYQNLKKNKKKNLS